MTHILFDGDIRRHPALRSLLWQWGVTVGSVPRDERDGSRLTVEDCDAVVQVGGEAGSGLPGSGAMPDGAEAEGAAAIAAAPLLVIGPGSSRGNPWMTIPDAGPGGARLRSALRSCEERARILRGDSSSRRDRDEFHDFLGHELRTPLTAIKTALTVIGNGEDLSGGGARMLRIAQRNLTRLQNTVEWSQELMVQAERIPAADLRTLSMTELAASLPDSLEGHLPGMEGARMVFTDPALVGALVRQMTRVLACACPGSRPEIRLGRDDESESGRLTISAPVEGPLADVENLTRMLISPNLILALGVKVRLALNADRQVELSIGLPNAAMAEAPDGEALLGV